MLETYLHWCAQQGIKINPRLSIRVPLGDTSLETSDAPVTEETEPGVHGMCVFANAFINDQEIGRLKCTVALETD